MFKYKLTLAYDGTCYSGWQIQPNGLSLQEIVQEKLKVLTRQNLYVTGAGRTDAGVHALGQTAHFIINESLDLARILYGLNGLLPKAIRILDLVKVSEDFHARYSALGKIYHYHLHTNRVADPFFYPYRWHFLKHLDSSLLIKAAQQFVGTHDFSSFTNQAHRGSASRGAVRTIRALNVISQEGGLRLEFEGNGFLYKMVRNIVGTLVEVASGQRAITDIQRLLLAKDRRQAGCAAPAHGLFLIKVLYPPEFQ